MLVVEESDPLCLFIFLTQISFPLHGAISPAKLEYRVKSSVEISGWTEETVRLGLHFSQKCQLFKKCCKLEPGSIFATDHNPNGFSDDRI